MQKFNGLFLTVTLSFFTLFLCELEGDVALKSHTPRQKFQDSHSLNASATTINISFEELLNFEEQTNPPSVNNFYTDASLNKIFFDVSSGYLKICDAFDFGTSIGTIIFPFHSFL